MIKIDKDLSAVPNSLNKGTVKSKRNGVISNGYPTSNSKSSKKDKDKVKKYDKHFKQKDTRDKLDIIYHSKCAFCEKKINKSNEENIVNKDEKNHSIDHYRPKSQYPWLAYSWDNLVWCCVECNKNKGNAFDIKNAKVLLDKKSFYEKIHKSIKEYNDIEKPKMIHPELEDVVDKLIFDENGNISSDDDRINYTIETCELDRPYLNSQRKKVLDEFKQKYNAKLIEDESLAREIIVNFLKIVSRDDIEFKAFHHWIENNLDRLLTNN